MSVTSGYAKTIEKITTANRDPGKGAAPDCGARPCQMEMEDIRLACNMSRGGLYHHFGNKRAILDALVEEEVIALADNLESANGMPIIALFEAGSGHLGNPPGLVAHLHLLEERQDYIASLELAFPALLAELLTAKLKEYVRPDVDPKACGGAFPDGQHPYQPARNPRRMVW